MCQCKMSFFPCHYLLFNGCPSFSYFVRRYLIDVYLGLSTRIRCWCFFLFVFFSVLFTLFMVHVLFLYFAARAAALMPSLQEEGMFTMMPFRKFFVHFFVQFYHLQGDSRRLRITYSFQNQLHKNNKVVQLQSPSFQVTRRV